MGVVLPKDLTGHCFDDSNLLHSKLPFGVTLHIDCSIQSKHLETERFLEPRMLRMYVRMYV